MAAPSPSLSISDIIHPLSPPPSAMNATKPPSPPPRTKSPTPEPLEPVEIEEMRRKVVSMGWDDASKGKDKANSREDELANMLLRLTHPAALPQPSQLHAQAETISNLIQQRDFLVKRSLEERERWEAEKESWARVAQALIAQGRREAAHWEARDSIAAHYGMVTADAATHRIQEYERVNSAQQNEKKMLQQKLNDTQYRLATLESELAQLRPLLLMQPFALMHSHPTGASRAWSAAVPSLGTPGRSTHKDRREDEDSEDEITPQHPQFRVPILRPVAPEPASPQKKGDYYRRRDVPPTGSYPPSAAKGKRAAPAASSSKAPISSDARTEHLLLAARKIGMQRATMLTGAFHHLHQQPPPPPQPPASPQKGKRPPASPTKTPRTPRRSTVANTPLFARTPLPIPQQRTPLQSLLSAAKSVLSVPSIPTGPPESPLAKKRKLDTSAVTVLQAIESPSPSRKGKAPAEPGKSIMAPLGRVRSALDFLADQAAAYSSQAPSQASADDDHAVDEDADVDVEMVDAALDATQETDSGEPLGETTRRSTRIKEKGKQRESPRRPIASSSVVSIVDDSENTQMEAQETQQTEEPQSRAGTPSQDTTEPLQSSGQLDSSSTKVASTSSSTPSGLAPPISLEPRSSRSPGPANPSRNSNRSRSQSAERHSSMDQMSSGSFNMFSLQRPQPLAAAGPSVLNGEYVEEQGPSMLLTSRIDGVKFIAEDPPHRTRSPYMKWSKEEDDLLAKAVAKYGQKWDLVQKELPSRGYHQVRQRWLRKLGVLETSRLDLSSVETNSAAEFLSMSTAPPAEHDSASPEPQLAGGNPKLGLAPLSSEMVGPSSGPEAGPSGEAEV